MINLLPPRKKQTIIYARRNTVIVRWLVGLGAALTGIALVTGGSLFYLRQDSKALKSSIETMQATLVEQKEDETLRRAQDMSGNIKLAVDVLSNGVLFSQLLEELTRILPSGTVLKNLSLTDNIASAGLSLEIGALDYEEGSKAHVNLNDPSNGIFQRADLEGIICDENDEESAPYICLVKIRALFTDNNPFLLISKESE